MFKKRQSLCLYGSLLFIAGIFVGKNTTLFTIQTIPVEASIDDIPRRDYKVYRQQKNSVISPFADDQVEYGSNHSFQNKIADIKLHNITNNVKLYDKKYIPLVFCQYNKDSFEWRFRESVDRLSDGMNLETYDYAKYEKNIQNWKMLMDFPMVYRKNGTFPLYQVQNQAGNIRLVRPESTKDNDYSKIKKITFSFRSNYSGFEILCPTLGAIFESQDRKVIYNKQTKEIYPQRINRNGNSEILKIEIQDQRILRILEACLVDIRLSPKMYFPVSHDNLLYGASGFYPNYGYFDLGDILIETTRGNFKIRMTRPLALVDIDVTDEDRIEFPFYSWAITQIIDDVIFQKTGNHLPQELHDWWSGESEIKHQKAIYEYVHYYTPFDPEKISPKN